MQKVEIFCDRCEDKIEDPFMQVDGYDLCYMCVVNLIKDHFSNFKDKPCKQRFLNHENCI